MGKAKQKQNKQTGERRWVKKAAAIFIIVMLLLTFLSNTIMNYSLAEVTTKKVQAASLSQSIRGTGTVTADYTYDVIMNEEGRKVDQILVSVGETVEQGDILFNLEDSINTEINTAQETLDDLNLQYQQSVLSAHYDYTAENSNITSMTEALNRAKSERNSYGTTSKSVADAKKAVTEASSKVDSLTAEISQKEAQLELLEEDSEERSELSKKISELNTELTTAQSNLSTAEAEYENANNIKDAENNVSSAQSDLNNAKAELEAQKKANQQKSESEKLEQEGLLKKIANQQVVVDDLRKNAVGNEVIAEYGGIISEININDGYTIDSGTSLVKIQVTSEGYTSEISVTPNEAKSISVDDSAEVSSSAGVSNIKATVKMIKDNIGGGDTSGESTGSKVVVLKIEGEDLSVGESLDFTLSNNSTTYEALVPNSAINTDSKGKFVLVMNQKSTALGKRYTVSRAGVTVIESDDTSCAVNGVSAADTVIISASKPIEAGDYVRLSTEN